MAMTHESYQAFNNLPLSHDPSSINEHEKISSRYTEVPT